MATRSSINQTGSHEERIPMCKKHDITIAMICEDCRMLLCSKCVKTDHLDHNWDTITTSASLRRRELKEYLLKITRELTQQIEKKIQAAAIQMKDNKALHDNEVLKLQHHYDAIVKEVNDIKEDKENSLKGRVKKKIEELCKNKTDLENKKKEVIDLVEIIEEKNRAMSDYILIHNLRGLDNLMSNKDNDIQKIGYSIRYIKGDLNDKILKYVMGRILNVADIAELEPDISTADPLDYFYSLSIGMGVLFKKCSIL